MDLTQNAIKWLASGERGISSNTMFTAITGINALSHGYKSHPLDPDDFRRCELLLKAVPEFRSELGKLTSLSPIWAKLVEKWDEIVDLFESEVPGVFHPPPKYGIADKTYELMKSLGC